MNNNHLLDRKFFNIVTRNNNNYNNEEKNVKTTINQNNVVFFDREKFKNQTNTTDNTTINKNIDYQNDKDKKINDLRFNSYATKYKNRINLDRIGYNDSNKKEEIYYKPYERNLAVKNKNLTKLDFIDKNKKTEYYKNINLDKFNPNINYKDFLN